MQAFSKQLFSFPQVAVKWDPTFCSQHQKPPLPTSTEVMFFHYFLCCVTLGGTAGVASPGCNPWVGWYGKTAVYMQQIPIHATDGQDPVFLPCCMVRLVAAQQLGWVIFFHISQLLVFLLTFSSFFSYHRSVAFLMFWCLSLPQHVSAIFRQSFVLLSDHVSSPFHLTLYFFFYNFLDLSFSSSQLSLHLIIQLFSHTCSLRCFSSVLAIALSPNHTHMPKLHRNSGLLSGESFHPSLYLSGQYFYPSNYKFLEIFLSIITPATFLCAFAPDFIPPNPHGHPRIYFYTDTNNRLCLAYISRLKPTKVFVWQYNNKRQTLRYRVHYATKVFDARTLRNKSFSAQRS